MLKGIFFVSTSDHNYTVKLLKKLLDQTKEVGLSGFCYHFSNGGTIQLALNDPILKTEFGEYDLTPCYSRIKDNSKVVSAISEEEIIEVMNYAKELGLEFIPSLDVPGHMRYILKQFPQFALEGSADSIDIKNPEAVAFALAFVEKYAKFFSQFDCKLFGVGADEFAQGLNNEMGFDTIYENGEMKYFVEFLNKVINCVATLGFDPIGWNDGIYYNEDAEKYGKFDNRLIVLYWSPGWGRRFASPAFIEAQGHRMINCYHTLYVPFHTEHDSYEGKLDLLRNHKPNVIVDRDGVIKESFKLKDSLGTFMCNWGPVDDEPENMPKDMWPYMEAFGEGYKSYK